MFLFKTICVQMHIAFLTHINCWLTTSLQLTTTMLSLGISDYKVFSLKIWKIWSSIFLIVDIVIGTFFPLSQKKSFCHKDFKFFLTHRFINFVFCSQTMQFPSIHNCRIQSSAPQRSIPFLSTYIHSVVLDCIGVQIHTHHALFVVA